MRLISMFKKCSVIFSIVFVFSLMQIYLPEAQARTQYYSRVKLVKEKKPYTIDTSSTAPFVGPFASKFRKLKPYYGIFYNQIISTYETQAKQAIIKAQNMEEGNNSSLSSEPLTYVRVGMVSRETGRLFNELIKIRNEYIRLLSLAHVAALNSSQGIVQGGFLQEHRRTTYTPIRQLGPTRFFNAPQMEYIAQSYSSLLHKTYNRFAETYMKFRESYLSDPVSKTYIYRRN